MNHYYLFSVDEKPTWILFYTSEPTPESKYTRCYNLPYREWEDVITADAPKFSALKAVNEIEQISETEALAYMI